MLSLSLTRFDIQIMPMKMRYPVLIVGLFSLCSSFVSGDGMHLVILLWINDFLTDSSITKSIP
jgi:hypothetical protein